MHLYTYGHQIECLLSTTSIRSFELRVTSLVPAVSVVRTIVVGTLIIIDSATKGGEISFTLEFATAVFVWLAILSTIYSGAIYVKGSINLIPQLTKASASHDD